MIKLDKIKIHIVKALLYVIKGINHLIPFASIFNKKIQNKINDLKVQLEYYKSNLEKISKK